MQRTQALSNSGRHVPINTFLRILRNMIFALGEWGQMILVQEYTLDNRLETTIFLHISYHGCKKGITNVNLYGTEYVHETALETRSYTRNQQINTLHN
jgi:hypothetical protein